VRQQMKNVRQQIKDLSIKEHKWNIQSFNDKLKALIATLRKNEEPYLDKDISDVVVNNYKLVKHQDFSSMITMELNLADKANQDIDYEEMMEIGEAKYESLVKQGVWGKRTPQEEQILALQTQLRALEAQTKQGASNSSKQSSTNDSAKKPKQQSKEPKYEPWRFENKGNKATMKRTSKYKGEQKEFTYYWCKHHNQGKGMWVAHKPSECKLKDKLDKDSSSSKAKPSLVANTTILDTESSSDQE